MRPTKLRNARTHNLKGVDLDIPAGQLIGIAGPSGAGKSSLAFGTLYSEGQRRYVESFSAYARQFLERLPRPPVDLLEPVPAAIAVDRQGTIRTSRSTVGTMTEIADYAKSLWAREAIFYCASTGEALRDDQPEAIADELIKKHNNAKVLITFRESIESKEDFVGLRERLVQEGYRRIAKGEDVLDLDEVRPSDIFATKKKTKKTGRKKTNDKKEVTGEITTHSLCQLPTYTTVAVLIDRLVLRKQDRSRIVEALEAGFARGNGIVDVTIKGGDTVSFSKGRSCTRCHRSYRDPSPGLFSFNNPIGACKKCRGFGREITPDWDKIIGEPNKTLAGGAITAWKGKAAQWERKELKKWAKKAKVPMDVPFCKLSKAERAWLIDGDEQGHPDGWWGIRGWFSWMESRQHKMLVRVFPRTTPKICPLRRLPRRTTQTDGLAMESLEPPHQ